MDFSTVATGVAGVFGEAGVRMIGRQHALKVRQYKGPSILRGDLTEIHVYVEPIITLNLEYIGVRFVRKRGLFRGFEDIPSSEIDIHELEALPRGREPQPEWKLERDTFGWRCDAANPVQRGPGVRQNFRLLIRAPHRPCMALLSFNAIFPKIGQCYGRMKVSRL